MVSACQFFSIFTSKCASRHSGVQFLISPLTTWLRTRCFNEPTFRLTRHTNHWKNTAFRDFSIIWRGCIFFLLTFALLHLLSSDSTSSSDFTFFWLYFIYLLFICFSTLHIVGSLLFKFPSIIIPTYLGSISSPTNPLNNQGFFHCSHESMGIPFQKTKQNFMKWNLARFFLRSSTKSTNSKEFIHTIYRDVNRKKTPPKKVVNSPTKSLALRFLKILK